MTGPDSAANSVGDRRRDPSRDGLTAEEAEARFDRIGPNEIPRGPRASWRRRFARQLLEPMALLLLVAAAVEGFGLGERLEAIAILAIVFLNAVIGTVQEGRAERALDALRSMEPRYATVVRDARRQRIDLARVVPGDIVVLGRRRPRPRRHRAAGRERPPGRRVGPDGRIAARRQAPCPPRSGMPTTGAPSREPS